MSQETFIAYWSGEEPTGSGQCPTLDQTPDYVNVVVLFYVLIDSDGSLNFDRLVLHNDQQTIMGWMADIRNRQSGQPNPTKFTLGILGDGFQTQDPATFAQTVKAAFDSWGVDGITVDYEPPSFDADELKVVVSVVQAIRSAIGDDAIMTAPIYSPWLSKPCVDALPAYAAVFNYIETMDYSPYTPGWDVASTEKQFVAYAKAIGGNDTPAYGKIAIGVSCMKPSNGYFTPLADVTSFCTYEPPGATKLGIMLYTLSYDCTFHGSGYPDWTFTTTIHDNLP